MPKRITRGLLAAGVLLASMALTTPNGNAETAPPEASIATASTHQQGCQLTAVYSSVNPRRRSYVSYTCRQVTDVYRAWIECHAGPYLTRVYGNTVAGNGVTTAVCYRGQPLYRYGIEIARVG
jgi:hypothetical protein